MKSYVLNRYENKVEVYETRYIPKRIRDDGSERFYSNCTLFIYLGSIPLNYHAYNTAHRQVEDCRNGDLSNTLYFGGRNNSYPFQHLTRMDAIKYIKKRTSVKAVVFHICPGRYM